MSIKVEKISGCKTKLEFNVDSNIFDEAIDKAFEKKIVDVEIKGFRKGKVPRRIFNERFGEESLYEEAMNIVINDQYIEAVTKKKLQVVGNPELKVDFASVGRGKDLKFTIEVEVWPEVKLGQYKEIEVEKESGEVTEKDIDEYIDRIRNNYAELVLVEDRALAEGDTAVLDFEGFKDGKAFEGGKAENYSLEIGSGQFIPGFEEQMVGMKADEEKTIKVTFPEEYQVEDLKGAEAEFKVKLHEIKERKLPELDEELIKELDIEDVKTVEQYKEFVKETLTKDKEEASENKLTNDLLTKAIENAELEVPEALIQEETNRYVSQLESQAKQYNIPLEQLLMFNGIESLEQYTEAMRPTSVMNVKQRAVFLKIAEEEKIKMTAKEYNDELKEIAKQVNRSVDEVKAVYNKEMITPYVQIRKVIDLIKDTAIIK